MKETKMNHLGKVEKKKKRLKNEKKSKKKIKTSEERGKKNSSVLLKKWFLSGVGRFGSHQIWVRVNESLQGPILLPHSHFPVWIPDLALISHRAWLINALHPWALVTLPALVLGSFCHSKPFFYLFFSQCVLRCPPPFLGPPCRTPQVTATIKAEM